MNNSVEIFTDEYLDSLQPKESDYVVTETACKGFSVRVYPSGIKTFVFRKRVNGGTQRTAIDRVENITIKEARLKALELGAILQVPDLRTVELKNKRTSTRYQLNRLYESYDWSLLSKNSQVEYSRYLEKFSKESKFEVIQSLTKRSSLKNYLDQIAREKPVTANRTKAAISKLINFLVDEDLLPYNVSHRLKNILRKQESVL